MRSVEANQSSLTSNAKRSALANLAAGDYLKIICGAAITSLRHIWKIVAAYTTANVSAIDVNAEPASIRAAIEGRADGLNYLRQHGRDAMPPLVMASITHGVDPHNLKARINAEKCRRCGLCLQACDCDGAINEEFQVDTSLCRGDGRCVASCPAGAIQMYSASPAEPIPDLVRRAIDAGAEAIELHLSGLPTTEVQRILNECRDSLDGLALISLCFLSAKTAPDVGKAQIGQACQIIRHRPLIIQADGLPMSGGTEGGVPGLQAIAAGELASFAIEDFPDVYVQISGGVTRDTLALANTLGVNIAGVGVGMASVLALKPEIDDFENFSCPAASRVVEKAREFVRAVRSRQTLSVRQTSRDRFFPGPSMIVVN